ncbi:hypothetical protein ACHAXS_006442 [Conticribra weissflogii]
MWNSIKATMALTKAKSMASDVGLSIPGQDESANGGPKNDAKIAKKVAKKQEELEQRRKEKEEREKELEQRKKDREKRRKELEKARGFR